MSPILKSTLFTVLTALPLFAGAVQAQETCTPPQLDTQSGCIWPEQLGLSIIMGRPLIGTAILTELDGASLGEHPPHEGLTYYRIANSSLILGVEDTQLLVREMFYLPR